MARGSEVRRKYERSGSSERDAKHRVGGDWTTIEVPEGISVFIPKAETYRFDIVPYLVKTGKETPGGNPYARKDTWYWERTYYVHRRVGPNGESWTCPSKTAGKRCPICEHRAALAKKNDSDPKLVKSLAPQERQLFLIHLRGDENDSGVMLYESAYRKSFGELLDRRRAKAAEDEVEKTDFDDPEAGATLVVEYEEETISNKQSGDSFKFIRASSIEFRPRKNGLDERILEHGIDLDAIIKILSYDKLKALFFQEVSEEDEDEDDEGVYVRGSGCQVGKNDEAGDRDRSRNRKESDEDLEEKETQEGSSETAEDLGIFVGTKVRTRKYGLCKVVRISRDGTSVDVQDSDGENHLGVKVGEVKPILASGKSHPSKQEEDPEELKSSDDEDDPWV